MKWDGRSGRGGGHRMQITHRAVGRHWRTMFTLSPPPFSSPLPPPSSPLHPPPLPPRLSPPPPPFPLPYHSS
eukprot:2048716-Pyramimonas_sp.AAC.1